MDNLQEELQERYANIEPDHFDLGAIKKRGRRFLWTQRAFRASGVVGIIAVIGLAVVLWPSEDSAPPVGETKTEISVVPLPDYPIDQAYGFGAMWSVALRTGELWKIDPDTGEVVDSLDLDPDDEPHSIGILSVGEGAIWASESGRSHTCDVLKIAPDLSGIIDRANVPSCSPLYLAGGLLWVSDMDDDEGGKPDYLIGLDPETLEETVRVETGPCCVREVTYAYGYLWTAVSDVASRATGEIDGEPSVPLRVYLQKIDIESQKVVAEYPLPGDTYVGGDQVIGGLVAFDRALWVSRPELNLIHRFDPVTGMVTGDVETGKPGPLGVLDGYVWVKSGNVLRKVDPAAGSITGRPIDLRYETSYEIIVGDGDLWFGSENDEELVHVTFGDSGCGTACASQSPTCEGEATLELSHQVGRPGRKIVVSGRWVSPLDEDAERVPAERIEVAWRPDDDSRRVGHSTPLLVLEAEPTCFFSGVFRVPEGEPGTYLITAQSVGTSVTTGFGQRRFVIPKGP